MSVEDDLKAIKNELFTEIVNWLKQHNHDVAANTELVTKQMDIYPSAVLLSSGMALLPAIENSVEHAIKNSTSSCNCDGWNVK